jgi:hypothetical protein
VKRQIAAVLACLSALTFLCGCDNILEDDILNVTAHQEPVATPSDSIIEAGTFDELKTDILGFVAAYENTGEIRVDISYDGDIRDDVNLACGQIMNEDPLGAYAVSEITGSSTKIVSYYQVEISIAYRVTEEEFDSIIPISSIRYMQSDLEDKLYEYAPSMVVQTKGITLTNDDAIRYVKEIYYDNPMHIVMMPVTSVEFFPDSGPDQIIVFTFGYTKYEANTLKVMEKSLQKSVQNIAESVSGDDAMILLDFCRHLTDTVEYDTYTAASGEYGDQYIAATAYGALLNRSAVSEGYAMAYKALCDELGINCYVVLGEYDGKPHAWNIVELNGDFYHIDVSMCDTNGLSTSFLLSDTAMAETYKWDETKYKSCDGPLTYDSVIEAINASPNTSTAESTSSPDT